MNLHDFWYEKAGFCGCGSPESVIELIRDALMILDVHPSSPQWGDRWADIVAMCGSEPTAYLLAYTLDRLGLTEHGGSVPGWLTDKGHDFITTVAKHGCDPDTYPGGTDH